MKNSDISSVKIIDFGIAGFWSLHGGGTDAMTLEYSPPEIVSKSFLASDPKIDVWSLGIIMYQMLEGRLPFKSKVEILSKDIIF